ncbi:CULLIN-2 domain-containing protein [Mycena sanguinolenta]|uniref:CULLIN-2 domain-containing protein n=1 Tax=Mycena sanguinolenta TaxID=230812 RepID=A0A8H6YXV6_9AGAR|nr:CULLIN-2 domain-containing protein [Mycena sanguinolenta]
MASVLQLLTLPAHSKGFTAIPDSITTTESYPPTKTPRLDGDSDSPSAARGSNRTNQPIKIQVIGTTTQRSRTPRASLSLQQCIRRLLTRDNGGGLPATFEAIYNECFSVVCVSNAGEGLYATLKLELEQVVSSLCRELLSLPKTTPTLKSSPESDDADVAAASVAKEWINKFVKTCKEFEGKVALLQSLLTYLDQVYVQRTQVATIRKLAFSTFVRSIFENPQLMVTLRNSVRTVITAERYLRMSFAEKTEDIPSLISHLYTHHQYSAFEEFYREVTWQYYERKSSELAEGVFQNNPKEFFNEIQKLIEEEVQRSKLLLPVGSWSIIRDATVKALLGGRMNWIAANTIGDYLNHRDFKNLKAMNELFSDAEGDKVICSVFKVHIEKTVQSIVKDAAADDTMAQRLLDCRAVADAAIKKCFVEEQVTLMDSDASKAESTSTVPVKRPRQEFIYALTDAFTVGFKARRNKPAEMIARHLDKLMRKGQGAMSDAEFEVLLDSALGLYRFTDDKDVFRGFYLRALAKRLLLERSASQDFESAVLKKLKDQYDPEFSLGEEMFSDLTLSRELMVEYNNKLPADAPRRLSAMVLKPAAWPYSTQDQNIVLPSDMLLELDAFGKFYKTKHSNRKLIPQYNVASATIIGHFKAGKKELSVSLHQAIILLLFNTSTEMSFSEIFNEVRMVDSLLRLTLQSLACGKKKVLRKVPLGRDINDSDIFQFNDDFEDSRAKVHINSIQAKVSQEESKQTQTAIDSERMLTLDAAIVRIMKAKKELLHSQLINATTDAVKNHFVPEVKHIKARIEKLMEQEYMRRDEDQPQKLLYVA